MTTTTGNWPGTTEGWWGAILIEFHPGVTGEDVRELLHLVKNELESNRPIVLKALITGPTKEGERG
jgi:hypothetical protein